jgi:DNA-binding transcriptional regulator GbsR (MarR family)
MTIGINRSMGRPYTLMLMAKSLCYDAVIAAT